MRVGWGSPNFMRKKRARGADWLSPKINFPLYRQSGGLPRLYYVHDSLLRYSGQRTKPKAEILKSFDEAVTFLTCRMWEQIPSRANFNAVWSVGGMVCETPAAWESDRAIYMKHIETKARSLIVLMRVFLRCVEKWSLQANLGRSISGPAGDGRFYFSSNRSQFSRSELAYGFSGDYTRELYTHTCSPTVPDFRVVSHSTSTLPLFYVFYLLFLVILATFCNGMYSVGGDVNE